MSSFPDTSCFRPLLWDIPLRAGGDGVECSPLPCMSLSPPSRERRQDCAAALSMPPAPTLCPPHKPLVPHLCPSLLSWNCSQTPLLAWGGVAASHPQRCGHHKKFLLLPDPYRLSWWNQSVPTDHKFPTDPECLAQVGFAFLACVVLLWALASGNGPRRIGCVWNSMSLVEMQHSSINFFCMNLHRRQT